MNAINIKERALKNISYSLLSFGGPVLIAIFVTPIIVHHFGVKEYGIYIFISTLVSLAGLLDLGVSVALSKFIAEKHGSQDKEGIKDLFKTTNTILVIIGLTGAIFIISSIFIGLVSFPGETVGAYRAYIPAFMYAGVLFFTNSISGLYALIPIAYQRFDISSKIGISFITIQQAGILAVVFLGWSINTLFLLQALLALVFYFVYKKYSMTILNPDECSYIRMYGWNKLVAIKCYRFGIVSFLNNLAGSSLTYLDRMIIPLFLGPSNLTFYSLPGSITNKVPSLSTTLSTVVFPMTAHFEGGGNREMTKNLYVRSMRLITIISTAVTISFIAFAYQMLEYWISPELAEKATSVLVILALTNLALAITYPLNNFLLGMGKLKALSITSVSTAVLNAILLVTLLPRFGLVGAAWAYFLALIPYIFLIYITEKSYLELTFRRAHYLKLMRQLFITSTIVFLVDVFFIKPLISSFPLVIVGLGISGILFMSTHYLLGFFEKEDSHDIYNFIRQAIATLNNRF
ncbi:MAG: polysaccharide biosynthesis C-terminal domain-containing protein [Candidatus Yonathbacteria bacterium]|nr:polysaccharide biosynthesis C-terminal domain-containing protein [Candidatus Yonathbacteria bacterium]